MQHRVSAVYLREFGFLEGNQWKITTMVKSEMAKMREVNKIWIGAKSVDSVTVELNEFDLHGLRPDIKRLLEEGFGIIETKWPKITEEVNTGKVSDETQAYINHFISSLLIRSKRFREMISHHIAQLYARQFLTDMGIWLDKKEVEALVDIIMGVPVEQRLNHACVLVWHHLASKLATFHSVYIKDYQNSGWSTSDDPVVLQNNFATNSILSINTELYFPLSKDWLVYMYHGNATMAMNPLNGVKNGTFLEGNEWIRYIYSEMCMWHADDLIFFPSQFKLSDKLR